MFDNPPVATTRRLCTRPGHAPVPGALHKELLADPSDVTRRRHVAGHSVFGRRDILEDRMSEQLRTTMFYDGGCPLCRQEVAHYRRLDQEGRIRWVDITRDPDVLDALGIPLHQAMARLHVRDASGRVLSGAWAFAAVWDELPYYRRLSQGLRALHLLAPLDIAYRRFARWRLRRRCDRGACAARPSAP